MINGILKIKISLSGIGLEKHTLDEALDKIVNNIAKKHKIKLEEDTFSLKFKELIENLGKDKPVVILIDEYDKPIIDYLENKTMDKATENKKILKEFYSIEQIAKQLRNYV